MTEVVIAGGGSKHPLLVERLGSPDVMVRSIALGGLGRVADPAQGIADVPTGDQRSDLGTGAGQHQPVEGLVRLEPLPAHVDRPMGHPGDVAQDRGQEEQRQGLRR